MSPRCELLIVMGVTDPDAERHRQQSMILVPMDTPGVHVVRSTSRVRLRRRAARRPRRDRLRRRPRAGREPARRGGRRLPRSRRRASGPGRIHHCMRAIGDGRARAGADVPAHGVAVDVRARRSSTTASSSDWIAEARIEIEQVRLLVLKTAWLMDTVGNRGARIEISAIKVAAPERRDLGDRPRDPGARRRRRLAGLPARRAVRASRAPCRSPTGPTRSTTWRSPGARPRRYREPVAA